MDSALLYDPARVRALAMKTTAAIRWLDGITSDEPMADDPIATLRRISHTFGTTWTPYFSQLLGDTSMVSWLSDGPTATTGPVASGFRSVAGEGDGSERPDLVAADMVDLAERASAGDDDALIELAEMFTRHADDPAIMFEFRRQLGDEGLSELVVTLESGTTLAGGALLDGSDVVAARERVLATLVPTPMAIPSDPDFDLSESIAPCPDDEWFNRVNPGCVDFGGPNADYAGGGIIVGPDGREYAITVPLVSDGDHHVFTGDVGPVSPGEPTVSNLNGADDGWEPVWYQSGIERFQNRPSAFDRLLGFAAGTTGLVTPLPPNGGLQFIQMRPGALPYLSATPEGTPPPIGSASPSVTDTVGGSPISQTVISGSVRGADGWVFAANMDNQRDRAYQVIFEEQEATGRLRARIETFTVGTDEAGDPVVIPEHVWVDDGTLMSQGICYAPPDGGVLTDVTPLAFDPDASPHAYAIPDQVFP